MGSGQKTLDAGEVSSWANLPEGGQERGSKRRLDRSRGKRLRSLKSGNGFPIDRGGAAEPVISLVANIEVVG